MEIKFENFITEEMKNYGDYKIVNFQGVDLCVFKCGEIYRMYTNIKNPYWKKIFNISNTKEGANTIGINGKNIYRHRIIYNTFKTFDINNQKIKIIHKDGNKMNNNINNLDISTIQSISFRKQCKGYYWDKCNQIWSARISVNGKNINLGNYKNEQDAHKAYLNAKLIYHANEIDYTQQELNELEELEADFQRVVFGH
jgi:hypothetical protein